MTLRFTYHGAFASAEYLNDISKRIANAPQEAKLSLFLFHTKCTEGVFCQTESCISLHPGQHGYAMGFVKRIPEPCPNEGHGVCSKKCGGNDGYCPYQHCDHGQSDYHNTLHPLRTSWEGSYCGKEHCTGHCNVCGLATEEEKEQVRLQSRREWGENR